jgi:hypothetical protein
MTSRARSRARVLGRRMGDEYWETIAERQFGTKIMLHDERAKRAKGRGDLTQASVRSC